jgi:hypothetical protein
MKILPDCHAHLQAPRNILGRPELLYREIIGNGSEQVTTMAALKTHNSDPLDGKTSRSIRDAVGERLQQYLKPQTMVPSPQLEHLLAELDRAERESRVRR